MQARGLSRSCRDRQLDSVTECRGLKYLSSLCKSSLWVLLRSSFVTPHQWLSPEIPVVLGCLFPVAGVDLPAQLLRCVQAAKSAGWRVNGCAPSDATKAWPCRGRVLSCFCSWSPEQRNEAERCEAQKCVAHKIFLPCIFLPSLGPTGRTGTEVVRRGNGTMASPCRSHSKSPPG